MVSSAGLARPRALWLATLVARATLGLCRVSATHRWPVWRHVIEGIRTARLLGLHAVKLGLSPYLDIHGGTAFTARADDGVVLHAHFLPAHALPPRRLPVLQLHGWLECKEQHLYEAHLLRWAGHDVILPDLRAHGASGGACCTCGRRESTDMVRVLDRAMELGLVTTPVLSAGLSLGAATALQHAALDRRVAGVVALAPFLDMREAVRSYRRLYASWVPENWALAGFERAAGRLGFDMNEASTLAAMPRIEAPVLLAAGADDRNLSLETHTRLLAAAKARGACQLVVVPDAHHFNIHRPRNPGLYRAIDQFMAGVSRDVLGR